MSGDETPDGTDGADGPGDGGDPHPDPDPGGVDRPDGTDHDWPVIDSRVEYETGWYTGGYDEVEQPDGSAKRYYWAELPDAAVVVSTLHGDLLMVEQFRPTIREHCLELPAGIVESGESFTDAGGRELREETGFEAAGLSLLETVNCTTGVLRHRRGIVWAEGLEPARRKLDGNEFLAVRTVPVEEALETVREPPTNDATLEGILIAREEGLL
ncbi:MAG: NUDIX hydrolase [Haloarculaceae archaeon]